MIFNLGEGDKRFFTRHVVHREGGGGGEIGGHMKIFSEVQHMIRWFEGFLVHTDLFWIRHDRVVR